MEFDENELDITEIEGLLIDTRLPNDEKCKVCSKRECEWKNSASCHFCPKCLDRFGRFGPGGPENRIVRPDEYLKNGEAQNGGFPPNCLAAASAPSTNVCRPTREQSGADRQSFQEHSDSSGFSHDKEKGCCGDETVNDNRSNGAVKSNQRITDTLCESHVKKNLAFFCVTCERPVCDECVLTAHEEHLVCKRFEVKSHLKQRNSDKAKGRHSAELWDALEAALCGINQQHGIAKLQVISQFDIQKRALEKWKENSLQELEDWRTEQESQVTEIHDILNELDGYSEDTCELIINSLRCGNALGSLSLKIVVKTQIAQIVGQCEPAQEISQNRETGRTSGVGNVEEASSFPSNTSRSFLTPTTSRKCHLLHSSSAETQSARQEEGLLVEKARQLEEARKVDAREFDEKARKFEENERKLEDKVRKAEEEVRKLAEEVRKADEARKLAEEMLKAEKARKSAGEALAEDILGDEDARKLAEEALPEKVLKAEETRKVEQVSNRPQDDNRPVIGSRYSLNLGNLPTCLPNNKIPRIPMELCLEFGKSGFKRGQFDCPGSVCVGWKENIYVADSGNNRIQVMDTKGYVMFEFGCTDLNYPYQIAAFKDTGVLVIVDWEGDNSRINLYSKSGKFIREIRPISPLGLVAGLTVTDTADIVIVHKDNATILVFHASGKLTQFSYGKYIESPRDVDFWGGEFFVTDYRGHAVVVFGQDGLFKRRFESKVKGDWYPGGICVTGDGTILVAYSCEHQFNVVGFNRVGQDLFFSRGPPSWVSTCCGLHLLSDGKMVTVSKKENLVLITKFAAGR